MPGDEGRTPSSGVREPLVVHVDGEIDVAAAPVLRDQLLDAISRGGDPVIVDLSRVGFMDSSGLAVLVTASRRLRSSGRELVLRSPCPPVLSALRLTRLDSVLVVEPAPLEAGA